MREMTFKMERPGLLAEGDHVEIHEGTLPRACYYTIKPSLAMSGNIPFPQRLQSREGTVTKVEQNERGYYVVAQFDEPAV